VLNTSLIHIGLWLIFLNVLIEQLGVPLPAFPTLVAAGALITQGSLALVPTFAVAFVASTIADIAWFIAGRFYGSAVMRLLCRVSLAPDTCVRQTEDRFGRLGGFTLVIAKFVPGLATVATPVAGALRLGWGPFLLLSSTGTVLWVGAALAAGALMHDQIDALFGQLRSWGPIAALVIAALFAAYAGAKWMQRRRFMKRLRVARIAVDELRHLIDEGREPLIVDVRSKVAKSVDPRIIPGAILLDMTEAQAEVASYPGDRDIVFYCTCPNDAGAAHVARVLIEHGYTRVRPLLGGLDAWIEAGYATELHTPPIEAYASATAVA
jgi:membrane protein DedA with SNARE-associated domain/rhodanese-related sulfurtransferase